MKRPRTRLGYVSVGNDERSYVNSVLDSTYLSPGKQTKKFESAIAEAHNMKFALALNSGQSAIMVTLEAAKLLGYIRCVAVPAVTYISSVAAVVQAGLKVRLIDVQPDAHAEMKWDAIPDECDAVLPCHLFGRANKFSDSSTWQDKFFCEDACESIYAKGLGYGDAVCLSFYPSHTITAGFGGMILTDDEDLYFKCWQLVNHGRQDMDDYSTCHTLKERFTFSEWGYSLKFCDLNAAFGYAQHTQRDGILYDRLVNATCLKNGLADIEELQFASAVNHTFMMFPIIVQGDERDALEKALNDEEIETRRMMPLTTQPIIREYFGAYNCDTNYPGAKFINEHGFYIGCHQGLGETDLDFMIQTIRNFYGK